MGIVSLWVSGPGTREIAGYMGLCAFCTGADLRGWRERRFGDSDSVRVDGQAGKSVRVPACLPSSWVTRLKPHDVT